MCERLKEILYERQRTRLSHLWLQWGFPLKATTVTCSLSEIQATGAINFNSDDYFTRYRNLFYNAVIHPYVQTISSSILSEMIRRGLERNYVYVLLIFFK